MFIYLFTYAGRVVWGLMAGSRKDRMALWPLGQCARQFWYSPAFTGKVLEFGRQAYPIPLARDATNAEDSVAVKPPFKLQRAATTGYRLVTGSTGVARYSFGDPSPSESRQCSSHVEWDTRDHR
jgi:hypothetical protein